MPPSQPDSEPYIRIPGSNFYHDTGAAESPSPSSMSGSQERLPQPVYQMIAQVTDELKNATYRVDLTAEGAILHADPNIVKAVIDHLESRHKLTHGTLKLPPGTANPRSKSSATDPRLPSDGFEDEDDSYNHMRLCGLRFHHFGNEVKGRYGFAKGLKLDGVGIIGELPTGTESSELSWEDIEVIVESKRTVRQMAQQSGMYTRFCLLNNLRRFFALGIGLHFTTLDVYVFAFHRSGFSSSRPLKLTTEEGFRDLVRHVVGMLSFKGRPLTVWTPHALKTCFPSTTAIMRFSVPFTSVAARGVVPPLYTA
ncbi:hypothetical protein F5888DRAFT_1881559 [Russula emetica]|nr:hypothetical protein F5888DRAFT_1881559 [Russula emetica]